VNLRPRVAEGQIVAALCTHGYGDVVEHPEQSFTDMALVEDFIQQSGGSLRRYAASGHFAGVEILLLTGAAAARWLAND
jgi:hypothetical protein